jgi:hypothetical protein
MSLMIPQWSLILTQPTEVRKHKTEWLYLHEPTVTYRNVYMETGKIIVILKKTHKNISYLYHIDYSSPTHSIQLCYLVYWSLYPDIIFCIREFPLLLYYKQSLPLKEGKVFYCFVHKVLLTFGTLTSTMKSDV